MTEWMRATWTFFHTIVCKIKDPNKMGPIVFLYIQRLCSVLPCPECSQHAKAYLSKYNPNSFRTKSQLVYFFFLFHNAVNLRLRKPQFLSANLGYYDHLHLVEKFNHFARSFHTNGNTQLMAENFHRQRLLHEFRRWLMQNLSQFHLGSTLNLPIPIPHPTEANTDADTDAEEEAEKDEGEEPDLPKEEGDALTL
jgi:hypothetical protein